MSFSYSTALHRAAYAADIKEVQSLLAGSDVEKLLTTSNLNNELPLDIVAVRGHYELTKIMLKAHQSLNIQYMVKDTFPILIAVAYWWLNTFQGNPADTVKGKANRKDPEVGYYKIMELLIEAFPEQAKSLDTKKHTSALYYIVYLLNNEAVEMRKNACEPKIYKNAEINFNRAKKIAVKLIEAGALLDAPCLTSGYSVRSLAKKYHLDGIIKHAEQLKKKEQTISITHAPIGKTGPEEKKIIVDTSQSLTSSIPKSTPSKKNITTIISHVSHNVIPMQFASSLFITNQNISSKSKFQTKDTPVKKLQKIVPSKKSMHSKMNCFTLQEIKAIISEFIHLQNKKLYVENEENICAKVYKVLNKQLFNDSQKSHIAEKLLFNCLSYETNSTGIFCFKKHTAKIIFHPEKLISLKLNSTKQKTNK